MMREKILILADKHIDPARTEQIFSELDILPEIIKKGDDLIHILEEMQPAILIMHLSDENMNLLLKLQKTLNTYCIAVLFLYQRKDGILLQSQTAVITKIYLPHDFHKEELDKAIKNLLSQHDIEQKAKENEILNKKLLNTLPDMYFKISLSGKILSVNPAVIENLRYPKKELIGKDLVKFMHPDDIPIIKDCIRELQIYKNKHKTSEYRMITRDGIFIRIHFSVQKLQFNKNIILTGRNLSRKKDAEFELLKTREHYEKLVENAGIAILIDDYEGNFKYYNKHLLKIFGYKKSELTNKSIEILIHPDERSEVIKRHKSRFIKDDIPSNYEFKGIKKNKEEVFIEVYIVPIKNTAGEITGTQSYMWNITARKKSHEHLQKSEYLYRETVNSLIDNSIFIIDKNYRIDLYNTSFKKLASQYGTHKISDKARIPDILPQLFSKHQKDYEQIFIHGKKMIKEENFQINGSTFCFETHKIPIKGKNNVEKIITIIRDLSKNRMHLEAIRESREQYRQLFNNMNNGVVVYEAWNNGEDFILKDANKACQVILDFKLKQAQGRKATAIFPKIKESGLMNVFQEVHNTRKPKKLPVYSMMNNKIEFWVEYYVYPLSNNSIVAMINDLSDKMKAMESLKESEALYKTLTLASPDGIVFIDTQGIVSYVSPNAYHIFKIENEHAILGKPALKWVDDNDKTRAGENLMKLLQGQEVGLKEYIMLRGDGTQFYCEILSASVRDADNNIVGVVVFTRDIDEKIRAKEELQRSEKMYRSVFENTGNASSIIEANGILVQVNEEFVKLSGYSREEIEGKMNFLKFVSPSDKERMLENHKKRRKDTHSVPRKYEFQFVRKNKEIRDIYLFIDMIPGTSKSIASLIDISNIKKQENNLKKSNLRLEQLAEAGSIGLIIHDKGNLLEANEEFFKMTGYETEEFSNANILGKIIADEDLSSIINHIKENKTSPYEARFIRKDKSSFHAMVFVKNMLMNNKQVRSEAIIDISDKKEAEEVIRKHQQLLNETQHFTKTGGWELDLKTKKQIWTYETHNIFETEVGFNPDINNIASFFPDTLIDDLYYQAIKGNSFDEEIPVITQTMKQKWIRITGKPYYDEHNQIYKISGIVQDISANKEAEKKLKESEERYSVIFKDSSIVSLIIDPQTGRIIDANPAAMQFYGYSYSELRNIRMTDLNTLNEKEFQKLCTKALNKEKNLFQLAHKLKNGKIKDVEVHSYPLVYKGKKVLYSIVLDQTKKKKMEEKLIEAQKMDSIGNLAGGFAHDINNMLGVVSGYISLLQMDENEPEKISYIDGIKNATQRASELTGKLLAFGRKEKKLIRSINVNNIITEVLKLLNHSMPKEIRTSGNLEKNIHYIDADPSQINQVLMNLCINSVEAMPEGGILSIESQNITLKNNDLISQPGAKAGNYILVTVKDTGHGIPKSIMKHIFEPFFTTKKSDTKVGTGLGLSTVYAIVKNHAGFIEVSSNSNKGTEFRIYFPKGKKIETENIEIPAYLEKGSGAILIIDDEDIVRKTIEQMLKRMGYKVLSEKTGLQGIETYKKNEKEIIGVILDMVMPNMGGMETFSALKKINPNIKVILSTGYGHNEAAQQMINLGVMDMISKPFNINSLSNIIKNFH